MQSIPNAQPISFERRAFLKKAGQKNSLVAPTEEHCYRNIAD